MGIGIVPDTEAYELTFGTAIHTGIAEIGKGQLAGDIDIDVIASAAATEISEFLKKSHPDEYIHEQATLVEGLLRAFHKYLWPKLMELYPKILAIEQEMSYQYESTLFMAKPDMIVADKDGTVFYLEWKTTSSKREEWVTSWNTAIQLHATTRAIEASFGESIGAVQVIGLYKGYFAYNKLSSPLVYAFKKNGSPPFSREEISYEYKAGMRRTPVWEMDGGVKAWVASMPESILASQFLCTPPIFVRDEMVDSFFEQRYYREQEINLAKQMLANIDDEEAKANILAVAFPQRFDQCHPAYGRPCAYERICHGSVLEPLKAGFRLRESHHAIEREANAQ